MWVTGRLINAASLQTVPGRLHLVHRLPVCAFSSALQAKRSYSSAIRSIAAFASGTRMPSETLRVCSARVRQCWASSWKKESPSTDRLPVAYSARLLFRRERAPPALQATQATGLTRVGAKAAWINSKRRLCRRVGFSRAMKLGQRAQNDYSPPMK